MLLYVAGPYRGMVEANIYEARQVAIKLWEAGHFALCPHLNTALFEHDCKVDDEVYINRDLDALARCDGIVMVQGWENSEGAKREHNYALENGMRVWYDPDYPASPPDPELYRPAQTRTFMRALMSMYRLYLTKNTDYSSAAFQVTGIDGPLTRLWEKVVRMMNLMGYNFEVSRSWRTPRQTPLNETNDEAWHDIANVAVICLLVEQGVWGR